MIAWTIYWSFLGALVLALWPRLRPELARGLALGFSLAGAACAVGAWAQFPGGTVTIVNAAWMPFLGIRYHLGMDGVSLVLVLLTALASVAGVLFSWNVVHRTREFFVFYLVLIGGVYGVFLSLDLFLFFVFYEIAIVPKYFLIAIWGSTRRDYAAMKLALYSFIGSAMVLLGLIAAFAVAGGTTMGLTELAQFAFPETFQRWAFPVVFLGFAILAGMWPFHTWAPTGHVAAPTAASMLLAGVVMKLGAYGCLRVAMVLFPQGLRWWQGEVALLGVAGIVLGALVALVQRDFKYVIGYSSVSHMGFVIVGLAAINESGLSGAVLQMFSHGVIAGLLFGVVGRMIYDRVHTRELTVLEGLRLSRALPFAAVTFVIASAASMGLPGMSGFVAEVQVLLGAWRVFPSVAVLAGVGIVIGVAYTLRVLQQAFFGEDRGPDLPHPPGAALGLKGVEPITWPERIGAIGLMATTVWVGLFPSTLLDLIRGGLRGPLFDGLWKGGGL